jgi:hypothetical protein
VLPEWPDVRRLTILADHYAFYLQDLQAYGQWMRAHGTDPDLPPSGWTSGAVHIHRIAVEPYSLTVGTARDDGVEAELRLHRAEPTTWVPDADHVVEADLEAPNGDLAVYGPADDPGQELHLSIAPGGYRVRVSYLPSEPPASEANQTGYGDYFIYRVDLWPTSKPSPLAVLKQGPDPWAGLATAERSNLRS